MGSLKDFERTPLHKPRALIGRSTCQSARAPPSGCASQVSRFPLAAGAVNQLHSNPRPRPFPPTVTAQTTRPGPALRALPLTNPPISAQIPPFLSPLIGCRGSIAALIGQPAGGRGLSAAEVIKAAAPAGGALSAAGRAAAAEVGERCRGRGQGATPGRAPPQGGTPKTAGTPRPKRGTPPERAAPCSGPARQRHGEGGPKEGAFGGVPGGFWGVPVGVWGGSRRVWGGSG